MSEANLSTPSGSVNEPLNAKESAQLEATLVLIRRGELTLATRVLRPEGDADLAKDIQAYIAAHSPNAKLKGGDR